jgi:hypothetical protein
MPDRTVIEVEVEGEREVCIGILQAIKYRTLAAADAGYPLLTSRVRSLVAGGGGSWTRNGGSLRMRSRQSTSYKKGE